MPTHREAPVWLVTGARGFLGANLGAFLQGRATRIGAARTGAPTGHFDEVVEGDLMAPQSLAEHIIRLHPDVVVNTAALADHGACERDPGLAEQVNARAPEVLATAATHAGALFIHISTDAVFDGAHGPYSEEDSPAPFSVYGQTKLAGEHGVMRHGEPLVVRTNFFGWSPSGNRSILEFFVNSLTAGQPVRGFTDFTVTSIYVQSLCAALWDLAATDTRGLLHVAASDSLSKYEFGVGVAEQFDLDASLITPSGSDIVPSRRRDLSLDVSRAESVLSRRLPTQRQGIEAALSDAALRRALQSNAGA